MTSSVFVSATALVFILAGTAVGVLLRNRLPDHHLNKESESVVRLGVGLIATMSALVLGLLIASAKGAYDTKTNEVNRMTADIVLVDQLLAQYGPELTPARQMLRTSVNAMIGNLWAEGGGPRGAFTPTAASIETWRLIRSLPTSTDTERALSSQITQVATHLSELRLLLFTQSGGSIPTPFLVILIFWLAIIFASFSLFGPMNPTVFAFTFLFALSAAGAIFLILELDTPFSGLLQIPKTAMLEALGPISP